MSQTQGTTQGIDTTVDMEVDGEGIAMLQDGLQANADMLSSGLGFMPKQSSKQMALPNIAFPALQAPPKSKSRGDRGDPKGEGKGKAPKVKAVNKAKAACNLQNPLAIDLMTLQQLTTQLEAVEAAWTTSFIQMLNRHAATIVDAQASLTEACATWAPDDERFAELQSAIALIRQNAAADMARSRTMLTPTAPRTAAAKRRPNPGEAAGSSGFV